MVGDGFLGFRAEINVGEDDVAPFAEQGFGEREVDTTASASDNGCLAR